MNDKLIPCLRDVCVVMGNMNCFRVYEIELLPHLENANFDTGFLGAMNNALLESALLNLRCLNEFFWKKTGRGSYIRALDFDVTDMAAFLTDEEVDRINKGLAHLTHERSLHLGGWPVYDMVKRGLQHGANFLQRVKADEKWEIDNRTTADIEAALKVERGFVLDIEELERTSQTSL